MASDKFIMMNLEDEKLKSVSEVLGNKTCKKIIDYLSEKKDASEKDLADALNIPINTTEYNLKKLIKSGLVEKTKDFFWSTKGKKIPMYRLSNKSILISPRSKSKIKSILPVTLISLAGALIIRYYYSAKESISAVEVQDFANQASVEASQKVFDSSTTIVSFSNPWLWFLGGAVLAIAIYTLFNWRKL